MTTRHSNRMKPLAEKLAAMFGTGAMCEVCGREVWAYNMTIGHQTPEEMRLKLCGECNSELECIAEDNARRKKV